MAVSTVLDQDAVRAEVNSPTYLGGLFDPTRRRWSSRPGWSGDCARPAWISAYESTNTRRWPGCTVDCCQRQLVRSGRNGSPWPRTRSRRCCGGCGCTPSLSYDLVLVTEPLSAAQLRSIGWRHRQGVGDASNLFHYYRLTRDDRILWRLHAAVPLRQPHRPGLRATQLDPHDARPALLHHVPPTGGPALHPPLGRRDRHQHQILRLLRYGARRQGRLRPRLHRPRSRATRFGAESCWTSCTPKTPNEPASAWSANAPSPSHPNPSAQPASTSPAGPWPKPTPTPAAETSGSKPSTASASASTSSGFGFNPRVLRSRSSLARATPDSHPPDFPHGLRQPPDLHRTDEGQGWSVYSSWWRIQVMVGSWGQPGGESSHSSWRP